MTHILLIEDDPMIAEPLAETLHANGYDVTTAADGKEGLHRALQTPYDLIVLDIMLPEMDGWEVCKGIRKQSTVPILMLTALGNEVDRILGLELGADDYLTKPFSSRELLARIRAVLRRVAFENEPKRPTLSAGDIVMDTQARTVTKDGNELHLRYKEFEILSLLMARQGEVVSRAELFDEVWGTDWLGDTRTLDVHIRWLREKIEDNPSKPRYIVTVHGVGYRLQGGN